MSIKKLKAASDLRGVAMLVGFKPKALAYLLYVRNQNSLYKPFSIPKASGGTRHILAPIDQLKLVQRRLASHLQNCLDEIEEKQTKKPSCVLSHGFKKNFSILTNAENHLKRRWVFNLDLEDFFPCINFGRVRGYFIKNKHFDLNPNIATILAQIICHQNQLPQGAPTSPVVSNLIAGLLDIRLNRIAYKNRCSYTRYADDITFSTNLAEFPISIGRKDSHGQWEVSNKLAKEIVSSGFRINSKKTRMQYRRSRQDVTGLVVNSEIGVKRETIKKVRSQVDYFIGAKARRAIKRGATPPAQSPITAEALQGHLSYISWIKGKKFSFKKASNDWKKEPGFVRTHRSFLDYQAFVRNPVPVLLCEGPTDNIYLKCAISSLTNAPSNLKKLTHGVPSGVGVRFFRYTKTTSWIQGLGGGIPNLKNLICNYEERMNILGVSKFDSPVIIVVDNDDGPRNANFNSVVKTKGSFNSPVNGSKEFYHITRNLYVVYTPKGRNGADTEIETFLPSSALKQKLDGKTLELDEKKFDRAKNFGKMDLATRIVLPQKSQLNFAKYLPLLKRISKAIEDFN